MIEHSLNVNSKAIPKKQRLHQFTQDKREVIKKELAKLLVASFIKEVYHPEWLVNPILVLKKNNKNGGYVRIILISTSTAGRIPLGSHASTKSSNPRWAMYCSIRLPSRKKIG
jgi:hypothetical protein